MSEKQPPVIKKEKFGLTGLEFKLRDFGVLNLTEPDAAQLHYELDRIYAYRPPVKLVPVDESRNDQLHQQE